MEGYFQSKLKRKDLEDVSDDFSDFSLSSPARKIRRLDADLPPIIEEEECEVPTSFVQTMLQEQQSFGTNSTGGLMIEELPSLPSNEERAIVLFKPVNATPFTHSPSNFSMSIDPHLVSVFKNQALRSSQSNSWSVSDDKRVENSNSGCLAVVPWVPSQHSATPEAEFTPCQIDNADMMDAQEVEEAKMDVEDGTGIDQNNVNEAGGMGLSEGFHQWQQQQQHCLIPHLPQNTTAPIVWYR